MKRLLLFVIIFALSFSCAQTLKAVGAAVITAGRASGSINACSGSPSIDIEQFNVSGTGLTGNLNVTAPAGFEVSLNPGGNFSNSLMLAPSGGTLARVTVYVRSSAMAAPGNLTGAVTLSSPGATGQTVNVSATIYALPGIDQPGSQTVNNGDYTVPVNFSGTANTYTWSNNTPGIGLPATGYGNISPFIASNTGNAPITAVITATPVSSAYAYIVNFGGNDVLVTNATTGAVIATIPVPQGPLRLLRGLDGSKIYLTSFGAVSVISKVSNTVIATYPSSAFPTGITQSPDGSLVYVANPGLNGSPSTISVISAASNQIVATIPVNKPATDIAVSPDGSKLYVANGTDQTVSVINALTYAVIANIPVGAVVNQISISPDGSFLYLVNQNGNSVTVVNTATNTVAASIPVGQSPNDLRVSPDGQKVYVVNTADQTVSVIDTKKNAVTALVPVGIAPFALAFSPGGGKLYVVNNGAGSVSVIDAASNAVISTFSINIRFASLSAIVIEGGGCDGAPVSFTIKVNPTSATAKITASSPNGNITSCQGTPSGAGLQQFTVSAIGLSDNLTASAPAGFDISLAPESGFAKTIVLQPSGGTVNNTIIYVRSSASAPPGVQSDYITLASPGTASQHVAVTSTIATVPSVNAVPDQIVSNGNPTTAVNFTGAANAYNWINNTPGIGLPSSGTGNIASFTAVNTGSSPVTATITVTPVSSQLAYIANGSSNSVSVIDVKTNTVIATIPVSGFPSSVAVSSDGSRVYVACRDSRSIAVINTLTNSILYAIDVTPVDPAGITLSPDGKLLYVLDSNSYNFSVLDIASGAVIAGFNINAQPGDLVPGPDGKYLYIGDEDNNAVAVVSCSNYTVVNTISVGAGPSGMVFSPSGSLLYVANGNSNSISVINASAGSVVTTIPVPYGPSAITISPDGSLLYLVNPSGNVNSVSVVSTKTNAVITSIPVGDNPYGISVVKDGSEVLVTNYNSGSVSAIGTATNTVTANIQVGDNPFSLKDFITGGIPCPGIPVKFTITVEPTAKPAIITGPVSGSITACAGSASAAPNVQQFTISGISLTGDITLTAPPGFEISLTANDGYAGMLSIPPTAGAISNTLISVRSAAAASGNITGNILIASPGVVSQNVPVSGTIGTQLSPSVGIAASVNPVCPGEPVTFTATPVNGGSSPAYQWMLNNLNVGFNSASYTNSAPADGDLVRCVMTGNAACAVPAAAASNDITITVVQPVTPSVSISASANNVCAGTPVTFNAIAVNGGNTPAYQWMVNGTGAGTNNNLFASSTLQNADMVSCTVTSSAGCAVPAAAVSNTIPVNVLPAPAVDAGTNKTISKGSSVMLNAVTTGDITDITWSPAAGLSNNKIANPVASPASTTTYTVRVQTANGCTAMSSLTVEVLMPIVIPNTFTPNGDGINDTWNIKYLDAYLNCTVQVFNRWGQNLYSSVGYPTPWNGTYKGAAVPGGTYYYIINLRNGGPLLSGFLVILR